MCLKHFTVLLIVLTVIVVAKTSDNFSVVSTTTTEQPPNNAITAILVKQLEYGTKLDNYNQRITNLESQNTQLLKSLSELNQKFEPKPKRSCQEWLESGNHVSGTYFIQPQSVPFLVFCEMNSRNGGWTVFHNRFDGSQDFYLKWKNYKEGFGSFSGEFWLGLDHLYELTTSKLYELLVELVDFDNKTAYAYYSYFRVDGEDEGYKLTLYGYEGTAGDSLAYHSGMKFTTVDKDQDLDKSRNCAHRYTGAGWFKACLWNNLNGRYLRGPVSSKDEHTGMNWSGFRGGRYSLFKARMMIRPA